MEGIGIIEFEVEVETSEIPIPEELDEKPNFSTKLLEIQIPTDLSKYFEFFVQEGNDSSEEITLKCLVENCGAIILYTREGEWHNCSMHLKNAHPTLLDENEMSLTSDGHGVTELSEESGSHQNSQNPVSLSTNTVNVTETQSRSSPKRKRKQPGQNFIIPADLDEYFDCVAEANDTCKLKCAVPDCGRIITHKKTKGWYNSRRHLERAHSILECEDKKYWKPRANSKSSSFAKVEMTHKIPARSAPELVKLARLGKRTLRVSLERLDPDPSKWPSVTSSDGDHYVGVCFMCGETADEETLAQQRKILQRRRRNYSKGICRLLKIKQSDTNFMDFLSKSKHCKKCWRNIKRISEIYAAVDRMENELLEWRTQVENLLKGNLKNATKSSGDEISQKEPMEIIRMLMEEATKEPMPVVVTASATSQSAPANIYESTDFEDEFNEIHDNDMDEDEDDDEDKFEDEDDFNIFMEQESTGTNVHPEMTEIKTYKCSREGCTQVFDTKERRLRHDKVVHGMGLEYPGIRFKCEKCDAFDVETVFTNRVGLMNHLAQDNLHPWFVNGTWTCEICSKTLTFVKSIKHHRRSHARFDLTEQNCTICSLKCSSNEDLFAHSLLHQTDKPFHCVLCEIVLSSSVELKRHMLLNHSDAVGVAARLKCGFPGCEKTFKDSKIKNQHESKCHRGIVGVRCPEPGCDVICSGKVQLEQHMNVHSDEKKFQCDICGAQLKYRKGLVRHRKFHLVRQGVAKFNYECKICRKSFESSQTLSRHEEIHSGLKDKLCDICGKSFGTRQNLVQHHKTHFKDKYPYVPRKRERKGARKKKKEKAHIPQTEKEASNHFPREVESEYVISDVYSLQLPSSQQQEQTNFTTSQTLNENEYDYTVSSVITSSEQQF